MSPTPAEASQLTAHGSDTEPYVRFHQVTKCYGTTVVLRDLDLNVDRSERVALIGSSGSGKTTILRLLMTLERPDGGEIYVDRQSLTHEMRRGQKVPCGEHQLRKIRRNIGMVFQHFNLFPHMSALRNVAIAPERVLGKARAEAEQRAKEVLTHVGLKHKIDALPGQLSGGQQQRVAIARALAMEPKVMLFDEVTSALDPELVGEVLHVLSDIATETSMAMLIVTHEMNFARHIADRVLMFDEGRIVESGAPAAIFDNPQSQRTQRFLRALDDR